MTKIPSPAAVVLSTEAAMETREVIPEVVVEIAQGGTQTSQMEDGVALEEVDTPADIKIHAETKEDMEDGISRNRMAHGTRWEHSKTT